VALGRQCRNKSHLYSHTFTFKFIGYLQRESLFPRVQSDEVTERALPSLLYILLSIAFQVRLENVLLFFWRRFRPDVSVRKS
jgi:hypothetical protein